MLGNAGVNSQSCHGEGKGRVKFVNKSSSTCCTGISSTIAIAAAVHRPSLAFIRFMVQPRFVQLESAFGFRKIPCVILTVKSRRCHWESHFDCDLLVGAFHNQVRNFKVATPAVAVRARLAALHRNRNFTTTAPTIATNKRVAVAHRFEARFFERSTRTSSLSVRDFLRSFLRSLIFMLSVYHFLLKLQAREQF